MPQCTHWRISSSEGASVLGAYPLKASGRSSEVTSPRGYRELHRLSAAVDRFDGPERELREDPEDEHGDDLQREEGVHALEYLVQVDEMPGDAFEVVGSHRDVRREERRLLVDGRHDPEEERIGRDAVRVLVVERGQDRQEERQGEGR